MNFGGGTNIRSTAHAFTWSKHSFLFLLDIVVFSVVYPHIHLQLLIGLTCTIAPWLSQTQIIWNISSYFPTSLNLLPLPAFLPDIHTQRSGFLTLLWPFHIICSPIHLAFHSFNIYWVLTIYQVLFWKYRDVQMGHCLCPYWAGSWVE